MTDRVFPEYRRGSHRPLPVGWPSTVAALSAALEPVPDEMELAWLCTERHGIPEELAAGRLGVGLRMTKGWLCTERHGIPEELAAGRLGVGLRMTKGWFCPEIPECAGRLSREMPFHFSGFCLYKDGKHCHRALVLHTNWETSRFSQPLQTVGELKACLGKAPKSAPGVRPGLEPPVRGCGGGGPLLAGIWTLIPRSRRKFPPASPWTTGSTCSLARMSGERSTCS